MLPCPAEKSGSSCLIQPCAAPELLFCFVEFHACALFTRRLFRTIFFSGSTVIIQVELALLRKENPWPFIHQTSELQHGPIWSSKIALGTLLVSRLWNTRDECCQSHDTHRGKQFRPGDAPAQPGVQGTECGSACFLQAHRSSLPSRVLAGLHAPCCILFKVICFLV